MRIGNQLYCFNLQFLALFVMPSIGLMADSSIEGRRAVFSVSVSKPTGAFEFSLWKSPVDKEKLSLSIKVRPIQNNTVAMADEAQALEQFFKEVSLRNINVKKIESICLPDIKEVEVQNRLIEAAAQSSTWKGRGHEFHGKIVSALLMENHIYREIENVLKDYKMKIRKIDAENILTKKISSDKGNDASVEVPYCATIYLNLDL